MSTILTERKRFNYNVGAGLSSRNNSQKKININPIIHTSHQKDQNMQAIKVPQSKETNKKIEELEAINKKIVEDTTEQFKKLELDVQRVEKILEEKQSQVFELQADKQVLQDSLTKINQEKNILIEAIFEKDLVIKEFEEKLNEFLKNRFQPQVQSRVTTIKQTSTTQTQTDPIPETGVKNELNVYASKNRELENELFEVKQELFDAQNKVKLITQQFEAYKILKQIESVQDV